MLPPGEQRQTLLFSATMTQALIRLQEAALDDAFVFQVRARRHMLPHACLPAWEAVLGADASWRQGQSH